MSELTVWVSCHSHRARGKLLRVIGEGAPSYGIWPEDGWPRGEFYTVTPAQAEEVTGVKGLRVMKSAPKGKIFQRWS